MAKSEEQKVQKAATAAEQEGVTEQTTVMAPLSDEAVKAAVETEKVKDTKKKKAKKKQTIYTIKLIPDDDGDTKSIRLSERVLKYGIASVAAGALLFVGAFSYSVYSTFANQNGAAEIHELREVNNIQQEQLLQLSKKANALQDEIDQLTQLESDLRRMSGASPAQDDGSAMAAA